MSSRNSEEIERWWHRVMKKPKSAAERNVWSKPSQLNVDALALAYSGKDIRDLKESQCNSVYGDSGDPYLPSTVARESNKGAYFGIDINPLEVMFVKTNRPRLMETINRYTSWADDAGAVWNRELEICVDEG